MTKFSLLDRVANDGAGAVLAERQTRVEEFVKTSQKRAETYIASDKLIVAVDVALSLGRPLLLTGEPGSGKTLAAYWIAQQLGLQDDTHFHEFQVRSDSRARDACYTFDAVSWFRASQLVRRSVSKEAFVKPGPLGLAFGWRTRVIDKPHVVLIDEIDKAPRDFPNDLLLELDQMRFDLPETAERIGPPSHRPIVVITSNADRHLPDPFLRRCVTHRITLDDTTVQRILAVHLNGFKGDEDLSRVPVPSLTKAASDFWLYLNGISALSRKPTIAEFWQWVALATQYPEIDADGKAVDLEAALAGRTSAKVARLPRIDTLLLPSDLAILGGL